MIARTGLLCVLATVAAWPSWATAAVAVPSWTTYHHDGQRSGIDSDSTSPVTPTQVWQASGLDGAVYAEPLVYGDRVYVATENDTVYALDSATGAVVWQKHLATAAPSSSQTCGNISPVIGITSTPVIDPASGAIYVVAETWNGSSVQHQLFGLNLTDGSSTPGLPVTVDPAGSTAASQLQRTGLALDAGKVIIGFGGNYGDCGSYHGWLVAVPEGGGSLQTFEVDPSTNGGAIWGSGNAPPVDSSGDVWTSTGNGSSSSFGNQESVLRLDSNLNLLDHWAPSNWSSLDSGDTDLGSSMPLLLPNGLVFQIGKQGVGYLLSGSSLGGTGGAPAFQASVCSGSWGGGIYVNGVIYVACSDGMHALSLNTTARTFSALPGWTVSSNAEGPPIFAGGLVWSAGWGNGVLYGLDPASGATRFSQSLGGFEHFSTPSAAGGDLFVANRTAVTAFKIANYSAGPPVATTTATSLSSSANPSARGTPITFTATVTPAPDGGTITFTDGGHTIAGCATIAIAAGGHVSCTTRYRAAGAHTIAASYSGDASFSASASATVRQVVLAPPVVSKLRVTVSRRGLRMKLALSQNALLTFRLYRVVPGRIVHRRCVAGARRGRRCQALRARATIRVLRRHGVVKLLLRVGRLRPGTYELLVVAGNQVGLRSKPRTAFFHG